MTRRGDRTLAWAVIAGVLALAACSTERGPPPASGASDVAPLGKTLAGDECQAKRRSASTGAAANELAIDIACGKSDAVIGRVSAAALSTAAPAASAARRDAAEQALKNTAAGAAIATSMTCERGEWLATEGGSDALIRPCALKDSGWPQIVVVTPLGSRLYVAQGLPALLPVLEQAVAGLSGTPFRLAEEANEVKRLEAALKRPLADFGAADFADYSDLMRLARLYNGKQDFAGAETAERRALTIQTRLFGSASPRVGESLMALALDVSNQGRFEEASALFRRAEGTIEASSSAFDRGRLASYRALDAANRGHFGEALRFAREATALRRAAVTAGFDQPADLAASAIRAVDNGEVAHSLIIEAAMALRLDDLPNAEAAATDALRIIVETPSVPLWWRAEALSMMGDVNAREGRFAAAERNYLDTLAFRQRLFGDTAPTALAYFQLGRLYGREEVYPASIQNFRSALAILSRDSAARKELLPDQLVPFMTAALAEAKRDPAQASGLEEDMFRASQLPATGVAAQTVARASARLAAASADVADLMRAMQDAERRRDSMRLELADETAKPDTERDITREARLATELTSASGAAETLVHQLRDRFPAYGSLIEPGGISLADTRRLLRNGEALLSFVIGREGRYGLLVRPDRFTARAVEITEQGLTADVGELRQALGPRPGGLGVYDLRAAFALYQKLMGPFAAELDGVSHLIVAAGGPMASLPLALLVDRHPAAGAEHDYATAAWLARRFAVSQVPSVQVFAALRAAPRPVLAPSAFLGIGAPAFVGRRAAATTGSQAPSALDALASQCRDETPVAAALLRDLAPLPETASEVKAVGRLLGADQGSILLGEDATEAKFRALRPERYRILYFSTHGLLPGELRCQSEPALALSPPRQPAASRAEDGLLEASEVASLKLDAELVVLSACNTAATGRRFGGEALAGLAEAFFYAGARTLVASHWQVPSTATARLMTGMFERIGSDLSGGVAEALRRAQLQLLDQPATAHPFFWAAFSVIGDGGASSPARGSVAAADRPAGEQP